jgi:hypothetical protein
MLNNVVCRNLVLIEIRKWLRVGGRNPPPLHSTTSSISLWLLQKGSTQGEVGVVCFQSLGAGNGIQAIPTTKKNFFKQSESMVVTMIKK